MYLPSPRFVGWAENVFFACKQYPISPPMANPAVLEIKGRPVTCCNTRIIENPIRVLIAPQMPNRIIVRVSLVDQKDCIMYSVLVKLEVCGKSMQKFDRIACALSLLMWFLGMKDIFSYDAGC